MSYGASYCFEDKTPTWVFWDLKSTETVTAQVGASALCCSAEFIGVGLTSTLGSMLLFIGDSRMNGNLVKALRYIEILGGLCGLRSEKQFA